MTRRTANSAPERRLGLCRECCRLVGRTRVVEIVLGRVRSAAAVEIWGNRKGGGCGAAGSELDGFGQCLVGAWRGSRARRRLV